MPVSFCVNAGRDAWITEKDVLVFCTVESLNDSSKSNKYLSQVYQ